MKMFFRIACLVLLLSGTRAEDFGFDLSDALDDVATPKPKAVDPPKNNDDFGLDLSDALGEDDPPPAEPKPPVVNNPSSGGGGGGTIKDSDLTDLLGGGGGGGGEGGHYEPDGGHYKPDGGHGGGGYGRGEDPAYNPAYDDNSGGNQQEASSGTMAGIVSAIGVALVGAASSYFAYQKKKLCFKLQGGQDPEQGNRHMTQSEPQVMSNLLQTS